MKMNSTQFSAISTAISLRKPRGGFAQTANTKRRGAFSLVELLVVVSVIAVLVAFMVPVLRGSREAGQLVVCAGNLKNVAHTTQSYMVDSFGQYPTYDTLTAGYDAGVLVCPVDFDPLIFPAGTVNNTKDLTISFGLNIEYTNDPTKIITVRNTPSASSKSVFFDGGRSTADIQIANGPGYSNNGNGSTNKGKNGNVNIIHKPGTPAEQDKNVPVAALGGHMGHGDMLGSLPPSGSVKASDLAQWDFNPRHQISGYLGNVLFADWHVNSYKAMDGSMFLYP